MLKEKVEMRLLPRDAELALGVIGGLLGLIGTILYLQFNMVPGNEEIITDFLHGLLRIGACIIAFKAAYNVQYEAKHSAIIFVLSGLTLLTLVKATIPGGIVLLIVGIMCFLRK
ncbi:hypothetical protein [Paucisalibacillus globulus]|jgi:hypothetical protein|uniref:hypothetical protein n=1 Tax=Paucisalibacillus globulus TaxID=351095 RepID=UPI0004030021|nr:hypothetical protein [Paucisalibacillus globulus]